MMLKNFEVGDINNCSICKKEFDIKCGFLTLGKSTPDKSTFFISAEDKNFGPLKVGFFKEFTFVFHHFFEDDKKFANFTVAKTCSHQILFELINRIDDDSNQSSKDGFLDLSGLKEILNQKGKNFPYEDFQQVLSESLKCMCVFLKKRSLKYNYHLGALKLEADVLHMIVKLWSNKNLQEVEAPFHDLYIPHLYKPDSYNGNPRSDFHMGYQIKYSYHQITWEDILNGLFAGPFFIGETATIGDISLSFTISKKYAKNLEDTRNYL